MGCTWLHAYPVHPYMCTCSRKCRNGKESITADSVIEAACICHLKSLRGLERQEASHKTVQRLTKCLSLCIVLTKDFPWVRHLRRKGIPICWGENILIQQWFTALVWIRRENSVAMTTSSSRNRHTWWEVLMRINGKSPSSQSSHSNIPENQVSRNMK